VRKYVFVKHAHFMDSHPTIDDHSVIPKTLHLAAQCETEQIHVFPSTYQEKKNSFLFYFLLIKKVNSH
jgi:hypothetical protein